VSMPEAVHCKSNNSGRPWLTLQSAMDARGDDATNFGGPFFAAGAMRPSSSR
jgi:hypothetical protein